MRAQAVQQATPACPRRGLAGVVIFGWCILAAAACDRVGLRDEPETLELEGDTVQLAAGVRVIGIAVETDAEGGEFEPVRAQARPGDVVRFTAGDARMHAIAFDGDRLPPDARAFLDRSSQLRGPPLMAAGTQWVVNLAGAPPGEYPFTCITHGVHGSLTVSADTPR